MIRSAFWPASGARRAALLVLAPACGPVVDAGSLGVARLGLDSDCVKLGPELVQHACLHATAGPFQTVTASPERVFASAEPHVNETHTHYTVQLPGGAEGTVNYRPLRGGEWGILTEPPAPLVVLDAENRELGVLLRHAETGCSLLSEASVYAFEALGLYRIVMPAATSGRTALVIERLEDFQAYYVRDRDQDGFGTVRAPEDFRASACAAAPGWVRYGLGEAPEDCDDDEPSIFPGAPELCDGVDRNCNDVALEPGCEPFSEADGAGSATDSALSHNVPDGTGCSIPARGRGAPEEDRGWQWLTVGLAGVLAARRLSTAVERAGVPRAGEES